MPSSCGTIGGIAVGGSAVGFFRGATVGFAGGAACGFAIGFVAGGLAGVAAGGFAIGFAAGFAAGLTAGLAGGLFAGPFASLGTTMILPQAPQRIFRPASCASTSSTWPEGQMRRRIIYSSA